MPPASRVSITFEVPADIKTFYGNLARISHSPADIVIDFALALPGDPKAMVQTRVVMSPLSAKLFLHALGENMSRFEAAFGEIVLPGNSSLAEHLFRPQKPPDAPKKE